MLPAGVVLITLGADLQADRIELEIVGWGRDEESWSLAYIVLPGDPAQRDLWDAFDQVLSLTFEHPCGRELEIAAACVDSGFHQSIVQQFCSERQRRSARPRCIRSKAWRASVPSGRACTARRKTSGRCGWSVWTPPRRRCTPG